MKRIVLLLALGALGLAAGAQELKPQGQIQVQGQPPVIKVDKDKLKGVLKIAIPHPIVFSRSGDQKGLWKREVDGTEKHLSSGDDTGPASYTDGRIYFNRRANNQTNIWSMKRDGSDERLEISDGYNPQPYASVVAFIRKEPGDLGKVWLIVKIANEYRKVASAGWVARGYYISRPVFEPGTSKIIAGSYEKDDGGAKPKVRVRSYNFDGSYTDLWSGVADGVSGLAAYKDGGVIRRLGILSPEGQSTDIWKLDGGAGSAKLIADPDGETSLDATSEGKLLIGAGGKLYMAAKTGGGRILVTEGSGGIWLD